MCKKLIVLALVLGLSSYASAALEAYYQFNEIGNTAFQTTADSADGFTGTLMGVTNGGATIVPDDGSLAAASSVYDGTARAGGGVVALDGVDDYVTLGITTIGPSPLTNHTVMAWVHNDQWWAAGETVVSHGGNWELFGGWGGYYGLYSATGQFGAGPATNSVWVHLAMTFEGGVGAKYYADGVEIASIATASATTPNGTEEYRIGRGMGGGDDRYIGGRMDEVRIYSDTLTEAQIQECSGVPEPATIALLGLGGLALIRRKR